MAVPFQTPPNEKSFSGLIDAAILATGKPGSLVAAIQYANMAIRECQAFGLFARDLQEDIIVATQDNYIWPRPYLFKRARTFKYLSSGVTPKLILPGRAQKHELRYYYAADDYFVFKGVSANEQIASAIYYWAKSLAYYNLLGVNSSIFPGGPYATRPAYYDSLQDKWQYLAADGLSYVDTTGDTTIDEALQKQATNWLVTDWYDLILSGTKGKIWNASGDPRASAEYSLYKQMQTLLRNTTGYESEGF